MKKTLLILCALLLTSIGASAQTTAYEFTPTNWVGVSGRSADAGQVTYDTDGKTITVTALLAPTTSLSLTVVGNRVSIPQATTSPQSRSTSW